MRSVVKHCGRWIGPAWVLPLASLALPNCIFVHGTAGPSISTGTTLVRCDLALEEPERSCATETDIPFGVSLAAAAVALAQGDTGKISGLDYSPEAKARCGGQPEMIQFRNEYPAGTEVCVSPNAVGPGHVFATSTDVCVQKCLDMKDAGDPPSPFLLDLCRQRARASTNVAPNPNLLFGGVCTSSGILRDDFVDPRINAEPVIWENLHHVSVIGTNLVRTDDCLAPACSDVRFDGGAAGLNLVTHGDGYVEFSVDEINSLGQRMNRVGGLTSGKGQDDDDPDFSTIGFGIDFARDGCIYVFQHGQTQTAPVPLPECVNPAFAFGHYATGDRFRISFTDRFDGTASIVYGKLPGPCNPGSPCPAPSFFPFQPDVVVTGTYPFHVDSSFEDKDGRLLDVRVVYIH